MRTVKTSAAIAVIFAAWVFLLAQWWIAANT